MRLILLKDFIRLPIPHTSFYFLFFFLVSIWYRDDNKKNLISLVRIKQKKINIYNTCDVWCKIMMGKKVIDERLNYLNIDFERFMWLNFFLHFSATMSG